MSDPQPTPQPLAPGLAGLNLNPTGKSKSNVYGLDSTVAAANVYGLGGLIPGLVEGKDGTNTGLQAADAFAALEKSGQHTLIANLQNQLMLGGYYATKKDTPDWGSIHDDDVQAFNGLIKDSTQNKGDLKSLLSGAALHGQYAGVAAAVSAQQSKAREIKQEAPAAIGDLIDKTYQNILGHKPNPSERAGFIAAYNSAYAQAQTGAYDSLAQATQDAQANNPARKFLADDHNFSSDALTPKNVPTPGSAASFAAAEHSGGASAAPPAAALPSPADMLAQASSGGATNAMTTQFDPQSFANAAARNAHPDQAGAHDLAGQFSNFMQIIGGGMR